MAYYSQSESDPALSNNGTHYVKPSSIPRYSTSRKIFVGGISWETSEESFFKYFNKYGEIIDSVIMMDKHSGRRRGFGFVTFADSAVADKVLAQEHIIDGRVVDIKRTFPKENVKEDMEVTAVFKTKKIFIGGLPYFFTDDELKEYFSTYGNIVEYQIVLDRNTGRSRGFGFVTFDSEDSVDRIFSVGKIHEIEGKQVEIKRAEPKRSVADDGSLWQRSYGGYGNGMEGFGELDSRAPNQGKNGVCLPHTDSGMNGPYGHFEGSYGGNFAPDYGSYWGKAYGYGWPMYCFGQYASNIAVYEDANAYGPYAGRYHPYWK